MDFEFSAEQTLMRESVRRYLAERAPIAWVRERWIGADRGTTEDVWKGLAALGACGLLVPESHGGAGMTMVDAAVVLEELGRAVNTAPFATSAVGATSLLLRAGVAHDYDTWLSALATGDVIASVAWHEPGRRAAWQDSGVRATRDRGGSDSRLTGTKVHVPHALDAHVLFVVAADERGGVGVYAVEHDAAALSVTAEEAIDAGHPTATLRFDGTLCRRLGGAEPAAAVHAMVDRLGVAWCVDAVGAAARALELAVEYGHDRVAFGRPIGSFQAVQHLCADMLRAVELGRAAAYYACWALDAAPPAEAHRAATLAMAHCAGALPAVGGSAVQVFGGIGFTWEHDVHLYYKRLLHVGYALGSADDYLEELAAIAIG